MGVYIVLIRSDELDYILVYVYMKAMYFTRHKLLLYDTI